MLLESQYRARGSGATISVMNFVDTTATKKIFQLDKRIRCVCGGTSASKTISILFWCIDRASAFPPANKGETELISIVSESFPHLRKGAMLDFQNIMKDRGFWNDSQWDITNSTYTFRSGSKIEFFSTDSGKAHGPRRDILFVNEGNNIPYEIFDQLRVRTKKIIWVDWNPTNEFWYYTDFRDSFDHDFITLTYKDNEALDPLIVLDIESHRGNTNWWRVYGEGKLGDVDSKVYSNWNIINKIPFGARLERRGLDFGYSRDPAALVDVWYYNGGYIFDERMYATGMSNKRIADTIKNLNANHGIMTYADSAEPKSIDEIYGYGVAIMGANKGPGSVSQGIGYIQDQVVSVTQTSTNLIREYRNYLWKTDEKAITKANPSGILKIPEDHQEDHALDAIRYAMESIKPPMPKYRQRNNRGVGINLGMPG